MTYSTLSQDESTGDGLICLNRELAAVVLATAERTADVNPHRAVFFVD